VIRLVKPLRPVASDSFTTQQSSVSGLSNPTDAQTPLQNLTQLNFLHLIFDLGIIPAVVYSLVWIPHLQQNPTPGFLEMQKQILGYHQHIGSGAQEHPYCSAWYTWPWMIRPVGYFFEKTGNTPNPSSALGSAMSATTGQELYYDVHGMGNPVLWWLSTLAIILVLSMLILRIQAWATVPETTTNQNIPFVQPVDFWIALYLIVNYAANLLPWLRVTRCTFLYHYMGSSIFAFLAIAWIVEQCLRSYLVWLRAVGVTIIFFIFLAFLFWLPVYLGLPLSPEEFQLRMLFRSWI
jgi:dolichyl-phosphate-mannose--protein O-mannosyl transferase